jgi:hypothetical protein
VKRLKPHATDNLGAMLDRAAFYVDRDVIAYLLELGANPNNRADGGSSALEACIRNLGWDVYDRIRYDYATTYQTPSCRVPKTREAITLLLQHGAMWKPDPSTLNGVRRILYHIEPDVTVELIGQLLKNENGEAGVQELLRVPRPEGKWLRSPRRGCSASTGTSSMKRSGPSRPRRLPLDTESLVWRSQRSVDVFGFRRRPAATGPREQPVNASRRRRSSRA